MKTKTVLQTLLILFALSAPTLAYPPAPPHEIYGTIRDEQGDILSRSSVQVLLTTESGVHLYGGVYSAPIDGMNYRLTVPMDVGLTPEPYLPTALNSLAPFRISVIIGTTPYVPIEMMGDYAHLGESGQSTRLNLTLGIDSDGDGLPDAWENVLISALGGAETLADITAGGDADGDGMSNLDEYLAGTYAFDELDFFKLYLKASTEETMTFEFLAITGHAYEIQRSADLFEWESIPFVMPAVDTNAITTYNAVDVSVLEIEVSKTNSATFYRGLIR